VAADALLLHTQVENVAGRAAPELVARLCRDADAVVFCAKHHWPSYWARLFAAHGYRPYDLLRDRIWWDQRLPWWQRQNVIVFATDRVAQANNWSTTTRSLDLAQPALLMPELREPLTATVCIPWRPSPSRLAAFERVMNFWSMFGWPVVTADSDTEIFSLAQARNNAVAKAATDVVVISDADTLIDPLNVLRAVAAPDGICWPFTRYRILSQDYLQTPLGELAGVPYINTWDGAGILGVGGCLICTRKEYWRLGGQPPEFVGWGWEDTAFTMIVQTLSHAHRLRGHAYAFEHNRNAERYIGAVADSPGWDRDAGRNAALLKRYQNAAGRGWLMRAMLTWRGVSPDDVTPAGLSSA
jgi:hypothetical protein